jgi:hypothetical protein
MPRDVRGRNLAKHFPASILNDMLPHQQLYGGTMEIEEGPMSEEEAVLTARRMWGNQAWVMSSGTIHGTVYMVSSGIPSSLMTDPLYASRYGIYGEGTSWEAAFIHAEERQPGIVRCALRRVMPEGMSGAAPGARAVPNTNS